MWYFRAPRLCLAFIVVLVAGINACFAQTAGTTIRIGGTGSAIGQMTRLAEAFGERYPEIAVEVLPSLSSSGGIRALGDGVIDIAMSARPMTPDEAGDDLYAVPLSRSPLAVVSSLPVSQPLYSKGLARLYADADARWPDGTPVRIILRPTSESDSIFLERNFDGMEDALAQACRRSEVPVALSDQDNIALVSQMTGSLTIATSAQVISEGAPLTAIPLDGVAPTLANLESGRYPFFKELILIRRADSSKAVAGFIDFIGSECGRQVLRGSGNLPLR